MNRLTKEQLAELDKRVLADMKNRAGTWRSPWSDDTMRWAWGALRGRQPEEMPDFLAAPAGVTATKPILERALQRLRKRGQIVYTAELGWRVEPTCTTCKAPLPYGAGVTINGKPWCSGCAPAEATP